MAPAPPAPKPDNLAGWSDSEKAELAELEGYLSGLRTEAERDTFVSLPKGTLTRANFDKLGWRGQNEHIRSGGRVVD